MRDDHDSDDQLRHTFREAERRRDFADLQNERAGLETGRMPRFLTADTREARGDRAKGSDKTGEHLSRLQQLLASNPAYAALYEDTFDKLRAAETATERALQLLITAHGKARQTLDDTLERAARLPDGTRVFGDEDGTVWTEHGARVTGAERKAIAWPEDAPSHESYLAQTQAVAQADQRIHALRTYQVNVLGHIRERMTDDKNPVEKQEMESFQQMIEDQAPEAATTEIEPGAASNEPAEASSFDVGMPPIK